MLMPPVKFVCRIASTTASGSAERARSSASAITCTAS
jgi:hypothetical protein